MAVLYSHIFILTRKQVKKIESIGHKNSNFEGGIKPVWPKEREKLPNHGSKVAFVMIYDIYDQFFH